MSECRTSSLPPACSGDDANAKVFLELLQKDKGEHCVRDQADACGNEALSVENIWRYSSTTMWCNAKDLFPVLKSHHKISKKLQLSAQSVQKVIVFSMSNETLARF